MGAKLKKDGMSGKAIDKSTEVQALVARLTELKAAQANPPAKPAAAAPAPIVASGDIDAQVKQVGDDIRELKAKLKKDGMSGKAIDKTAEVQALVAKLTELKAAQAAAPAQPAAAPAAAPAASGGDVKAQVDAVGNQIRELKAKLKADGLSGKAIDKTEEVKALVAKLTELKAQM